MSTKSQLTILLFRNLIRWYLGDYLCLRTTVYGQEPKTFLWFSFDCTLLVFKVLADNMFLISMQLFYEICRGKSGERALYHPLTTIEKKDLKVSVLF